jgi:small neutral amino acid transporter SnatA (MarC family)
MLKIKVNFLFQTILSLKSFKIDNIGIVGLGIILYLCLILGDRLLEALGKIEIGALNRVLGF